MWWRVACSLGCAGQHCVGGHACGGERRAVVLVSSAVEGHECVGERCRQWC
jgi:hypothetical protein